MRLVPAMTVISETCVSRPLQTTTAMDITDSPLEAVTYGRRGASDS